MNWKRLMKFYVKHQKKAVFLLKNRKQLIGLLREAVTKADDRKSSLSKVWEEIQCMFRALKAWVKGEYKEIPKSSLIAIVANLLYFVSPIDMLPDFLPFTGFLDDVTVIGFAATQIAKDLKKFRVWEDEKNSKVES